jgi:hypothetical protein
LDKSKNPKEKNAAGPLKSCKDFYPHHSDLGLLPTGREMPQPSSGGVGILFTT